MVNLFNRTDCWVLGAWIQTNAITLQGLEKLAFLSVDAAGRYTVMFFKNFRRIIETHDAEELMDRCNHVIQEYRQHQAFNAWLFVDIFEDAYHRLHAAVPRRSGV